MLAAAAAVLTITVRVYDLYGLPPDQQARALALAGETLAQANVAAQWIDCARDEHGVAPAACRPSLQPGELVVRIMDRTKRGDHILGTAIVQEDGPNVIASIYAGSVKARWVKSGVPSGHPPRARHRARDWPPAARHQQPRAVRHHARELEPEGAASRRVAVYP